MLKISCVYSAGSKRITQCKERVLVLVWHYQPQLLMNTTNLVAFNHDRQLITFNQLRSFSNSPKQGSDPSESPPEEKSATYAFDRSFKRLQRDNAARATRKWRSHDYNNPVTYDYFHQEVASRLVDRLDDIKRTEGFPLALDLGAGPGYVHRAICADDFILNDVSDLDDDENSHDTIRGPVGGIGGVRKLVQLDSSAEMLHRDEDIPVDGSHRCDSYRLRLEDYEDSKPLPFPNDTFDLVISSASLHWVNQIPRLFKEVSRVLKPDGCFMFAVIGGTTLPELRVSLVLAELEREGGIGPHVGPFVGLSDVGSLLQRAGFALPTLDVDTFTVSFPDATVLMEHLQRMGESNACIQRRGTISKDVLLAAACIYDHMFPLAESPHEIEASVQVVYAIGWKPHDSQQKPSRRGTASLRVGDIVENTKVS
jgi:NADH dehydrogenase [ubiquinone] 1 alpha subcomplex assembly factor 5